MWLVLFLLSSSVGIYLVIQSFINYFSFDVVTSIKVFKETPTEFPAITFFILRNKKFNISLNDLIFKCQFNNIECIISKDFKHHKGQNEYEDLLQCEAKPSALSSRGHQGPAAFLMMGSLLEKVKIKSIFYLA